MSKPLSNRRSVGIAERPAGLRCCRDRTADLPARKWPAAYGHNDSRFLTLAALVIVIDVGDTLSKGMAHFLKLGPHYVIGAIAFPILCGIGMATRRRSYHAAIAVISLADHAAQALENFLYLG